MQKLKPTIVLICFCLFLCAAHEPALGETYYVDPTLELNKTSFGPGEAIVVIFTASPDYPDNAWVGIIPSEVPHGDEAVNDQHDLAWQYLEGQTEGGFTEAEMRRFLDTGFRCAGLGRRTLRTETASLALLAALQYELGDWETDRTGDPACG